MSDTEAMNIHGIRLSDYSDSDTGKSEFDDEYYKNLPPASPIDMSKIIVINPKSELILSTQHLIKMSNKITSPSVNRNEGVVSNNTGAIQKKIQPQIDQPAVHKRNCQSKKRKKKSKKKINTISKLNMSDTEAMNIHGIRLSDYSDSDTGKSEFDDEYYKNLPPVSPIDMSKIIVINPKSELILSTQHLIKMSNKITSPSFNRSEGVLSNNTGAIQKKMQPQIDQPAVHKRNCQSKQRKKKINTQKFEEQNVNNIPVKDFIFTLHDAKTFSLSNNEKENVINYKSSTGTIILTDAQKKPGTFETSSRNSLNHMNVTTSNSQQNQPVKKFILTPHEAKTFSLSNNEKENVINYKSSTGRIILTDAQKKPDTFETSSRNSLNHMNVATSNSQQNQSLKNFILTPHDAKTFSLSNNEKENVINFKSSTGTIILTDAQKKPDTFETSSRNSLNHMNVVTSISQQRHPVFQEHHNSDRKFAINWTIEEKKYVNNVREVGKKTIPIDNKKNQHVAQEQPSKKATSFNTKYGFDTMIRESSTSQQNPFSQKNPFSSSEMISDNQENQLAIVRYLKKQAHQPVPNSDQQSNNLNDVPSHSQQTQPALVTQPKKQLQRALTAENCPQEQVYAETYNTNEEEDFFREKEEDCFCYKILKWRLFSNDE